jgi:hypothetical protein
MKCLFATAQYALSTSAYNDATAHSSPVEYYLPCQSGHGVRAEQGLIGIHTGDDSRPTESSVMETTPPRVGTLIVPVRGCGINSACPLHRNRELRIQEGPSQLVGDTPSNEISATAVFFRNGDNCVHAFLPRNSIHLRRTSLQTTLPSFI